MKLSISLPDAQAKEIQALAEKTDRNVSWWIRRAWETARTTLLREEAKAAASHQKFLKTLDDLTGILKPEYPDADSVSLSHQAFQPRKRVPV